MNGYFELADWPDEEPEINLDELYQDTGDPGA